MSLVFHPFVSATYSTVVGQTSHNTPTLENLKACSQLGQSVLDPLVENSVVSISNVQLGQVVVSR